ncbi:hypothetical protein DIPPA_26458 [Diplonema papillatum]|nr:hypothetical protein DIPPA_26458 [Diplonema papillatum]KAJ9464885.1 hypothetical protein DIPPA_26458 [Diplonema papillatum]
MPPVRSGGRRAEDLLLLRVAFVVLANQAGAAFVCLGKDEPACASDGRCAWQGAACNEVFAELGGGRCVDADGAAPPSYESALSGFTLAGGRCQLACVVFDECLGVSVRAGAQGGGTCIFYVDDELDKPPDGYTYANGTAETIDTGDGGTGQDRVCQARQCGASDCFCTGPCTVVSGYRGGCVCAAATGGPAVAQTDAPEIDNNGTDANETDAPSAAPLDECLGSVCPAPQRCDDPGPLDDSMYDFVCTCGDSSLHAVGGPVAQCTVDECAQLPCAVDQSCSEANTSAASIGDFTCTCVSNSELFSTGRPVTSCGVTPLDECDTLPCGADQSCADQDTSPTSIDDFVCTCSNGVQREAKRAVCDYDECVFSRCGTGQACVDDNSDPRSLLDFECTCLSSGAVSLAAPVADCFVVGDTPAPPELGRGDAVRVLPDGAAVAAAFNASRLPFDLDVLLLWLNQTGRIVSLDAFGNAEVLLDAAGTHQWFPKEALLWLDGAPPDLGDKSAADDELDWWRILLICVGAGLFVVVLVAVLCACYFVRRERGYVSRETDFHDLTRDQFDASLLSFPASSLGASVKRKKSNRTPLLMSQPPAVLASTLRASQPTVVRYRDDLDRDYEMDLFEMPSAGASSPRGVLSLSPPPKPNSPEFDAMWLASSVRGSASPFRVGKDTLYEREV